MENNEENQNLALQVLATVSQGCMIQPVELGIPVTVAYAEMWLDRNMFFFCELDGGETGTQHVVKFASFKPLSNQVLFYDADGKLVAGLAPYSEWPDIDANVMQGIWHQYSTDKAALEGCRLAAREWRHAELA